MNDPLEHFDIVGKIEMGLLLFKSVLTLFFVQWSYF